MHRDQLVGLQRLDRLRGDFVQSHFAEVGPTGFIGGDEGVRQPARHCNIINADTAIGHDQMLECVIDLGERG